MTDEQPDTGGDAACWLARVCAECGALDERLPRAAACARCGAAFPRDDAQLHEPTPRA